MWLLNAQPYVKQMHQYSPQGSEIILEEGWKDKELEHGEESCEMPSSGHGVAATLQLPAALDTYTGASQQNQPPSQ